MKTRKLFSVVLVFSILAMYLSLFGITQAYAASVLTVGPGKMYATPQAAFDAATAGDTIEIYSDGIYYGTDAYLLTSGKDNITIRGMNGRAQMIAKPGLRLLWGKALWVINAANITIENIEFQGATCSDKNGSGIRVDSGSSGTLTVRSCYFHNNDDGILTSAPSAGILNFIVEMTELAFNGYGDGYSHNIYVATNTNFTFRYSYSHNVLNGHLLKSRALTNYIEYNRITDEDTSTYYSNYNIDLPEGGTSYIIGNLLHQGSNASNNGMVSYAAENTNAPGRNCYIINNRWNIPSV